MMWYGDGMSWWGWLLMSLAMAAFWGGVIWLVWYLVTHATPSSQESTPPSSPERILDERFARGEIDVDEYRTRREALQAPVDRTAASVGRRR